ncbi:hypothetical protein D918_03924 [Trichuris suis]|nr:hypothetical protein D918_03924 [Trichuris suis]
MVDFPEEVLQDARDEEERLESFRLDENGRKVLNIFLLLKEKLSTAADSSGDLLPYVRQITKELEKRLSTSIA